MNGPLLLADDHALEHLSAHGLDVGALDALAQPPQDEGGLLRVAAEEVRDLVLVVDQRGDVRRRYTVPRGRLRVRHLNGND